MVDAFLCRLQKEVMLDRLLEGVQSGACFWGQKGPLRTVTGMVCSEFCSSDDTFAHTAH
jgi:hypothetical protein